MCETRSKSKLRQFQNNLINRKYSKDSFDRFGDDLCQLLLSYLSISDKIRFECVSKQWKQLVFNKQQKLQLIDSFWSSHNENDLVKRLVYKNGTNYKIRQNLFLNLFKKFTFIKQLEINLNSITINNRILQIIANNCKHLEKFVFRVNSLFFDVNEKQITIFGQKCGQKLKFICFEQYFSQPNDQNSNKLVDNLLHLTPNVEAFHYENISVITSKQNKFYSKLNEINISEGLANQKHIKEFITFTDNYCQQINKIRIDFDLTNDIKFDPFAQLSRFESLEKLVLYINDNNIKTSIDKGLVMIALKCKKLKDLTFDTDIELVSNYKSLKNKLFQIIGEFESLISCKITINYDQNSHSIDSICCESTKINENIKHLSVCIPELCDNHFKNIKLFFPKLIKLEILSEDSLISDKTMHCLAKMPKLSIINLNICAPDSDQVEETVDSSLRITDEGVCDIINNCLDLKKFSLNNSNSVITSKTIDTIISKKLNPKIKYEFEFEDNINGKLKEHINSIESLLPKNLEFNCY
jgi:hypothetical protein